MKIINKSTFIISFILLLPVCSTKEIVVVEPIGNEGQKRTTITSSIAVDPSMGNLISRIVGIVMGTPVVNTAETPKVKANVETKGPPQPVIDSVTENRNQGCLSKQKVSIKTSEISIHIGC
jgi:hypothetical protein